jgi:hypothetical protein
MTHSNKKNWSSKVDKININNKLIIYHWIEKVYKKQIKIYQN